MLLASDSQVTNWTQYQEPELFFSSAIKPIANFDTGRNVHPSHLFPSTAFQLFQQTSFPPHNYYLLMFFMIFLLLHSLLFTLAPFRYPRRNGSLAHTWGLWSFYTSGPASHGSPKANVCLHILQPFLAAFQTLRSLSREDNTLNAFSNDTITGNRFDGGRTLSFCCFGTVGFLSGLCSSHK